MKTGRIFIIIAAIAGFILITACWPAKPFLTTTGIISGFVGLPSGEAASNPQDPQDELHDDDEIAQSHQDNLLGGEDLTELPHTSLPNGEESMQPSFEESYQPPEESANDNVLPDGSPVRDESSTEISPESAPQKAGPEYLPDIDIGPEETESEPITPEEQLAKSMLALNDTSVVVMDFTELSNALSSDNGYVNIYLGADIAIYSGITIHPSKKSVLIDGVNPDDPERTVHTMSDYATNGILGTIGIRSNSGTKNLTVRNMNIFGRNFYGTFTVDYVATNVTLTYDNVKYLGPQLSFNRYGLVRYCNGTDITIDDTPGSDPRQEAAECNAVEFEGKVSITHHTPLVYSIFWFIGPGSYMRLLPGADVTLKSDSKEVFYVEYGPVDVILDEGSSLNVNTRYGFAYQAAGHNIGKLTLAKNAEFYLLKRELYLIEPALRLSGSITTAPGARFHVFAPFSSTVPLIRFITTGTGASFNDPDSVILYNGGGSPPFGWLVGSGYVNLYAQDVSYWRTAASLPAAGGLDNPPMYRWQKPSGSLLSIEAALNTPTTITSLNTNYTAADGPVAPTADTFSLLAARVLAFGRLPLALGNLMEGDAHIIGTTKPEASIRIQYQVGENERTVNSTAKESGLFQIEIPDFLPAGTIVTATANKDFLTRTDSTVVHAADYNLHFLRLPQSLTFRTTTLRPETGIIQREDTDFTIIVEDTRPQGAKWRLTVSVLQPMTTSHGHILHNALVYADESGNEKILGASSSLIAESTADSPVETSISWPDNAGLLLRVNPDYVLAEHNYEGLLSWALIDAP